MIFASQRLQWILFLYLVLHIDFYYAYGIFWESFKVYSKIYEKFKADVFSYTSSEKLLLFSAISSFVQILQGPELFNFSYK